MPRGAVVRFQDVRCLRETDKAILVEIDETEYWIPKSQIDQDSEVFEDMDEGELVITEWIAIEKKLV